MRYLRTRREFFGEDLEFAWGIVGDGDWGTRLEIIINRFVRYWVCCMEFVFHDLLQETTLYIRGQMNSMLLYEICGDQPRY